MVPQLRLEPPLLERARAANPEPGGVRFGVEVVGLREKRGHGDDDGDGDDGRTDAYVVLTVLDRATGATEDLRARYAIGADGGRTVTGALGIQWEGEKDVLASVTAHFRAPGLRAHVEDQSGTLNSFIDPAVDGGLGLGFCIIWVRIRWIALRGSGRLLLR